MPGTIHNDVSAAQLALKPEDRVEVTTDSHIKEYRRVKYAPWQLGNGTWVIGLRGIAGGYALCRVQPAAERADADEPYFKMN